MHSAGCIDAQIFCSQKTRAGMCAQPWFFVYLFSVTGCFILPGAATSFILIYANHVALLVARGVVVRVVFPVTQRSLSEISRCRVLYIGMI